MNTTLGIIILVVVLVLLRIIINLCRGAGMNSRWEEENKDEIERQNDDGEQQS
jgi:hypothetical protein